jgi:hypothetical protein
MTDSLNLGRIEWLDDIRSVWRDEALTFTPWLLANADLIGQALGIRLDLEESEHAVGGFGSTSLDATSITRRGSLSRTRSSRATTPISVSCWYTRPERTPPPLSGLRDRFAMNTGPLSTG